MNSTEKYIIKVDKELSDLVPRFIENRRKDIVKIDEAIKLKDFNALRLIGHNLHGVGGGYGFQYVTDVGIQINNAAKEKDLGRIQKLMANLSDYLDKIEVVFE